MININNSMLYRRLINMDAEHVLSGISSKEAGWTYVSTGKELNRLFYPISGQGWITIEKKKIPMKPGFLYLLPGNVCHSFGTDEGSESLVYYWTHYKMSLSDYNLMKDLSISFDTEVKDPQAITAVFEKLIRNQKSGSLIENWRTKAALLELTAYYMEYAGLELKIAAKQDVLDQINEMLSYIETHLNESISIEQLASIACLHPNYFITIFKSLIGVSPVNYMNERRLELAKTLLSDTDMPVSEIAARIGMQNHYLSRLFKQHFGVTPRRYRELSLSIDGSIKPPLKHEHIAELAAGREEAFDE